MYKYALTIKYIMKDIDCHYEDAIAILQRIHSFDVIWTTHERDQKGRIHIHSLIMTNRKIYVPRMNLKGYTVCIRPIIYERGWFDYARKDINPL